MHVLDDDAYRSLIFQQQTLTPAHPVYNSIFTIYAVETLVRTFLCDEDSETAEEYEMRTNRFK